jgi:hypothetical protein
VLDEEGLFQIGTKLREKLMMIAIIKRLLQDSEVSSKLTETMLSFCPQVKMKMWQKIVYLRWSKVAAAI